MMTKVYIANVKSEHFDYDKCDSYDYETNKDWKYPEKIGTSIDIGGYGLIPWKYKERVKKVDWSLRVLKLSKSDLIDFLKYELKHETLLNIAEKLEDEKEYLLVVVEDV